MANALKESWAAPALDSASSEELITVDPRIVADHAIGVLPCPLNPPPPDGWRYWPPKEKVPALLGTLAVKMRDNAERYPMGAFAQVMHAGELVGARVEWHDTRGRDGAKGCFRGVNLMRLMNNS